MKCAWRWQIHLAFLLMSTAVTSFCRAGRHRRMGAPNENNGVVRLQHGSFQCMGALLTPRIILTCCTCVSDVFFKCGEDSDQVTYEVRALSAENITVKSEEEKKVPCKDVFIHPQCDIDGTYDYGLVTVTQAIAGKKGGTGECLRAFRKSFGHAQTALPDALDIRNRLMKHRPTGLCTLHTILDASSDGELLTIFSQFVDWKNCWNGSETKPTFEAKYCLVTLDPRISLENAKCGSPVFCDHRLVGIMARRYAIGGNQFASVNGLDGAIEFVRETVKLDIREEANDEGEQGEVYRRKLSKKKNRERKSNQEKRNS